MGDESDEYRGALPIHQVKRFQCVLCVIVLRALLIKAKLQHVLLTCVILSMNCKR